SVERCGANSHAHTVIARLDRAIHYAAAYLLRHSRLWNTGSPAFAGDDSLREEAASVRSPNRRCVLDPAVIPELVQAARDLQLGAFADIAVIDFAVIADMLDDAHGPVLGKAEVHAIGAFVADKAHHVGLFRLHRLVDVLRGDAELLGVDHRIQRPFDDHHPVIVAL